MITDTQAYSVAVDIPANGYTTSDNAYIYQAPEGYKVVDFDVVHSGNAKVTVFGKSLTVYNKANRQYGISAYLSSSLSYEISVIPQVKIIMVRDL